MSQNSFATRTKIKVGSTTHEIFSLKLLEKAGFKNVSRLPFSLKVLLENLLRYEDGKTVTKEDIEAVATWDPKKNKQHQIAFRPSRVLLQDFTGVPAVVDLAAMREALKKLGGDPTKINPLQPADLVIDHSVQVDSFGSPDSLKVNTDLEFKRNRERYRFLRWGQQAFDNFRVVPPDTGIVHQVNLEYLARCVFEKKNDHGSILYPDTLVGTDSHTTMINGLGVVGWGVGGIEAEAAMLGQPISMLVPDVVGFRLHGELPEGSTATDLVLTVTQMLRQKGVVGKFVEFFGDGLSQLTLPDRATLANMAPEYGATTGFFPVDKETLRYLDFTGRDELTEVVKRYCQEQGLFRNSKTEDPLYTDTLELDLSTVVPSLAGPKRPQDRVPLDKAKSTFKHALIDTYREKELEKSVKVQDGDKNYPLTNGAVVIAAITSCTNTSNPEVMVAAGLLAKNALEKGLTTKPWVKTSLAPGSKVVTEYLEAAELMEPLNKLGFDLVGYGCTTCIGNSGPLPEPVAKGIQEGNIVAASVLSGNRNFEGRINPLVKANYLASPPLVVAYALAGTMDVDLYHEPIAKDSKGNPVYLKEIWPTQVEVREVIEESIQEEMFRKSYGQVFKGDDNWRSLEIPKGDTFAWEKDSTYVKHPPFFEGMKPEPDPLEDIIGARVLALLGDSVTTDHISPAGAIPLDSPAGKYLIEQGVDPKEFNSFGSRRGNHEVMMRGTFGNIRLRNLLAPGTEGGITRHMPDGEQMTIFDAAMKYQQEKIPLIVLAGKEYGTGSSRDWAAKGTRLLGVRAVIAESFERIHRSNLIGMGVLPLLLEEQSTYQELGITAAECFDVVGISEGLEPRQQLKIMARDDKGVKTFTVTVGIDTPTEVEYFRHGGILQFVLRQLLS